MQNKINHPFAQGKKSHRPTLLFAVVAMLTTGAAKIAQAADVVIETNRGVIEVVLDVDRAPLTVANFLAYVASDGYKDALFHRVCKRRLLHRLCKACGFTLMESFRPSTLPFHKVRAAQS